MLKHFSDLTKYRSIWMGLAILWVIFYHIGMEVNVPVLHELKSTGYGGVDIFVFCTGMGCFYSLERNSDLLDFYKRRFWRIYPTYWLFIPFWFIYKAFVGEFKPSYVVGNVLGVQTFSGNWNEVTWYISALFLFYLLCPVFYFLIKKTRDNQIALITIFAVLLLSTIAFWNSLHMNIITTRIPLLFLGMLFGNFCIRDAKISEAAKVTAIVLTVLGMVMLWAFTRFFREQVRPLGLWWYPFILIIPGLCLILAELANLLGKYKGTSYLLDAISRLGAISFELLLVHLLVFEMVNWLIEKQYFENTVIVWLVALCATLVLAVVLSKATNMLKSRIRGCRVRGN